MFPLVRAGAVLDACTCLAVEAGRGAQQMLCRVSL